MAKPKNIILLSDGTGNSAAKVWRTNVWRLFQALDLKGSSQIAIYDDGVGTSSFLPLAILGGVFGWGLKRNVLNLYKFLCRNYQAGDKIYGFGFSRGAFTIRVAIGLILDQGLVNFANEGELDRKTKAAYRAYRQARFPGLNLFYPFLYLRYLLDKRFYKPREREVDSIEFLGLWDTVAAYGLPVDEMTRGVNRWIMPLELPNTDFSGRILKARHALAIDDERATFHPVLWDENATNTQAAGAQRDTRDETLLQVWFTGMHANVGGGYPDDSLANVSLSWILAEARQAGLVFKTIARAEPDALLNTDSAKDKDGRLYDSRSGLGGYYRYSPRKIADFYEAMAKAAEKKGVAPGALVPKIHESVFGRIKMGAHLYGPIGLPKVYEVVTTGDVSLIYTPLPPDVTPDPMLIQPNAPPLAEGKDNALNRHKEQEGAWDLVWRKRVIYFLTVFATGYLFTYPLFRDTYAFEEVRTRLRVVSDTIRLLGSIAPSFAKRWLDAYAREPAWFLVAVVLVALLTIIGTRLAGTIKDTMRLIWVRFLPGSNTASAPAKPPPAFSAGHAALGLILAYLALYPLLLSWAPWSTPPYPYGDILAAYTAPPVAVLLALLLFACALPSSAVRWLRTRELYQATIRLFKFKLLPALSAFGLLLLALELISHFAFNLWDGLGRVCHENPAFLVVRARDADETVKNYGFEKIGNTNRRSRQITFDSSTTDACTATGVFVKKGWAYSVQVERAGDPWTFMGRPSYMGGQPISRLPRYTELFMAAIFPLRRTLDRPWGAFILRIGGKGNEEDFLDRQPPLESDAFLEDLKAAAVPKHEELGETLQPDRDGELFVYLNRPVFGWFSGLINPTGTAKITITYSER
ncbi:DUF2235 domain-containing protein [Bradyrhizobium barranii subsp. apii]|uniref:DUF2235 domain-containing protein n=1 Tax=Bradyrhizobium barranii TaxID=2992140 RepID=UPI001AA15086|nr:DUF2235 domain-containing protein [Bradyrhizobium barranii]UPT97723.1 DUF2235 domain-containing protein [Bradyrhizobium barranii subsp. apii]